MEFWDDVDSFPWACWHFNNYLYFYCYNISFSLYTFGYKIDSTKIQLTFKPIKKCIVSKTKCSTSWHVYRTQIFLQVPCKNLHKHKEIINATVCSTGIVFLSQKWFGFLFDILFAIRVTRSGFCPRFRHSPVTFQIHIQPA